MGSPGRVGQWVTLLVTNGVKVTGIVIAVKAAFSQTPPQPLEYGLAAFMVAGAQLSEETILKLFARMFAPPKDEPPPPPPPPPAASPAVLPGSKP